MLAGPRMMAPPMMMKRGPRMMDRMYPRGYPEPELTEEEKEQLRIQQATRRAHAEARRKEARRQ